MKRKKLKTTCEIHTPVGNSMKYYWLLSKDLRDNVWVFSDVPRGGARTIKPKYQHLVCPKCGKPDEPACLQLGLAENIKVRTKWDIFHSSDNVMIVSEKFQELLATHKIKGLDYYPNPAHKNFFITAPTGYAKVDSDHGQMRFLNQCRKCGRYKETTSRPPLRSIQIKKNQHLIFTELPSESTFGRKFFYLISEHLADLIKQEKLTGYCFSEAT